MAMIKNGYVCLKETCKGLNAASVKAGDGHLVITCNGQPPKVIHLPTDVTQEEIREAVSKTKLAIKTILES